MPKYVDQMGRAVDIPENPRRIISLVPSQTELLYSLGLEDRVVGVTKFCVHPEHWRKEKKIIGGTKNFHLEKIKALAPDLIIGNKEENYQEGIEALETEYPVWMSDIFTLDDALEMMQVIGEISGTEDKAAPLTTKIKNDFASLVPLPNIPSLYFIWRNPYMSVGNNTFIDEMMKGCGFHNLLAGQERYPEVSEEEIRTLNPQVVLLSSEPYPFKEKHVQEMKNLCPEAEVLLVDGEIFSWYGSRLGLAVPYFQNLQQELRLRLKI